MIWKVVVGIAVDIAKLRLARKLIEDAKAEMARREALKEGIKKVSLVLISLTFLISCTFLSHTYNDISPCQKLKLAESLSCSVDTGSSECIEARQLLHDKCGTAPPPVCPTGQKWCDERGGGCISDTETCKPYEPVVCMPGIKWCTEGTVCTQEGKDRCKHNPSPNPDYCELLPVCSVNPPPPVDDDPVTFADCPIWPLEPNAYVILLASGPYGKKGFYTTLMVKNSPSTCIAIHGNPINPNSCHLEGLKNQIRCERFLIKHFSKGKGECPIWWASTPEHPLFRCLQEDQFGNSMSCDHFGSADADKRDDPKTPEFEGKPAICGTYRDEKGNPMAGFFTIVLGNGKIGASLPGAQAPDNWLDYVEPN